ncbi:MAG: hypothetical protein A2901_08895 [Elusimicrobia bacterium RIFCSPLOWO2_01_FULL_54_10]|nr:MAG: hypothetical protein A2901_08895 [Elusimicrobia bacterium RIFCSPLOWO2_01_FULL_54_10]
MPLEDSIPFPCPFCGIENTAPVDLTGGKRQKFVVDCENCCHPILIKFEVGDDGVENFRSEKE